MLRFRGKVPCVELLFGKYFMLRRRTHLYAIASVLCLLTWSEAQAETLRDAVTAAIVSHPAVDIANAQRDAASEAESEEFSNLFPEISTTATGGRMFGNNATSRGLTVSRGEAYSWLWEGNASITQPIFNGFETYNRIDAARAREGASELTLADAKQGLALRAAQSFFNVMRAQEAYNKTVSYQDRIKDYLKRIHGMVEGGAADASEEAQAKNIQAQLENSVAEMEGQVKLALADYAEATGSMPSGELQETEAPKDQGFSDMQEAIEFASKNHPLILSAHKNLEAEDDEVSAEKGVLLPDLDGELSYLKRDQKEEIGGEVVDGRAVMRASWNFSTGGAQLARIRKAKAERSEALARTAQAQREIERDIRKAYAEYETAEKQKELNARRATVTKELFDTYTKQFEASKVRLLQLMQAENQVFTTELEQINSNYRLKMAEYSVLASAGRLLDALNIDPATTPDKTQPAAGE
ncbi:MAG: transporter [Micavibrio aeruginosavorus]|uniref:Transporter n=1 Tax=Micavibrio aeruginosavorus TaxID=349221 RepID=A0A2W5PV93_9BACT|nr:MAG: transporter [Micavibrio aeruginosavorus]